MSEHGVWMDVTNHQRNELGDEPFDKIIRARWSHYLWEHRLREVGEPVITWMEHWAGEAEEYTYEGETYFQPRWRVGLYCEVAPRKTPPADLADDDGCPND